MSEKNAFNSSVTFAKVVSGGGLPAEDQNVGGEINSSGSATDNEIKSSEDWPSLEVVAQQKCEENKSNNKPSAKKPINNSKDKTQETSTGDETETKAEEVSANSPTAINSPAGGNKKMSKNNWKKLDIEVDYNTAREVSDRRREFARRRDFERRERPQRRNTISGRDWKENGREMHGVGRDVGKENNNNCSEPKNDKNNFVPRHNRADRNRFDNNNHRRQISKEGNENAVVKTERNNGEQVETSPPLNVSHNNNNNEQPQDQSYWYFDDISNGYYYQHSGSQGWKKNSKHRQHSNNNYYRPQRQYSPNQGRYPINRQKYFKNSTSTQTEQTNNVTGINNSQGGQRGNGYQPRSHHSGGGHRYNNGLNNAYKYNNNNNKRMDEQLFSNSYFCSNNAINHHWTSSLQQLNISGISPTVVTATAVPSTPSTSLLSPNGLIPFPLVVAANTLQTAAVVVAAATTDQVPTTTTTQFAPTIITTTFPQNAIFVAPITTPYVPVDDCKLGELVRGQIEYYFSADNLQKDFFLRRKMDAEGFLPLSLIAGFPRIRSLTDDVSFILSCLRDSERIEFSADELKIRPRINPQQWPLHESSPQSGTETPLPATISDDDGNK